MCARRVLAGTRPRTVGTVASGSRAHTRLSVELGITPDWRLTRCANGNDALRQMVNSLSLAEIRNCAGGAPHRGAPATLYPRSARVRI